MQYAIRPMSFGEILDMGFQIVRNHFVQLVLIAAVIQVPLAILSVIATSYSTPGGTPTAPSGGAIAGMVIAGLGFVVLMPFAQVAITYAIGEMYQGRTTTFGRAFHEAFSIFLPLLGTSLLSGVLIALGLLLLLIPGIWMILGQVVLSQVMIFERRFGMNGVRRTLELMKGQRARAFGISFLTAILVGVLGFAFGLVGNLVTFTAPIASGIASAIGTAFGSAVAVVLYFDIRCRKEAFEIEHLARLVQSGATPPRPA